MTCPQPFGESVIELVPKLRAYARALTRDKADADDLVQETLTKALRYHDRFVAGPAPVIDGIRLQRRCFLGFPGTL